MPDENDQVIYPLLFTEEIRVTLMSLNKSGNLLRRSERTHSGTSNSEQTPQPHTSFPTYLLLLLMQLFFILFLGERIIEELFQGNSGSGLKIRD